jgi:hypothetical protein
MNKHDKLSILENSLYYRRETYERITKSGRLIPIKPSELKCIDGMKTERLLELRVISELAFICDTAFSDKDVMMIIKVHAPLDAKSYSTFRYNGETNNTFSLKFY